jgi:hypothetical protein
MTFRPDSVRTLHFGPRWGPEANPHDGSAVPRNPPVTEVSEIPVSRNSDIP